MIPFQERKKIRKVLYSKFSLFVLFVMLVFVTRGAWSIYQKAQIALAERDIAEHSLGELQSRTSELNASLASLNSAKGQEAEVRQKYTVAKPGEEVVVVVDDNSKKSENSGVATDKSIWQRVASFFGF